MGEKFSLRDEIRGMSGHKPVHLENKKYQEEMNKAYQEMIMGEENKYDAPLTEAQKHRKELHDVLL